MEFDWKRTPTNVREVTFDFNGRTFTHVTFDTVPLDNFDQFQNYRTAWDDYNKKTRCCIKTEADFLQFWAYVETKKMPKSITSYLSRKNGDLKRLKRDLCRAMKSRQAGFDKVFSRCGRLTHEQFCDALHQCFIPCTIDDLDYGKRCVFTPRQCANTATARQAIEKLRDTFYPELEIELFFPE